jgi:sialate O-acetylesterase
MKFFLSFLLIGFALLGAQSVQKNILEIPSIISDNMVLQQRSNVPLWGKAKPHSKIIVNASWGASSKAVVNNDSLWQLKLRTPKAGGPYKIKIQIGDSTIVYKNVLIGEVWLSSGQSNMEMPLQGWPPNDTISNSAQEIKNAQNPNLRFFTVTRAYSEKPNFNSTGEWTESNPGTAANFSATAFFFGKKLYNELKIPIGLIHSSWGGTPVEAWISKKYLTPLDEYKETLNKLDTCAPLIAKLNYWLKSHQVIDVSSKETLNKWKDLDFLDNECSNPDFDDSRWAKMVLPINWERTEIGNFDGVVWFRKKIEISKTWLNKELILELGAIDDIDLTFVNGQKIGGYEEDGFWQVNRVYTVPAELVKDSILTIAVRVIDNQGGGGIWGNNFPMILHTKENDEKISISGDWKYLPVAEYAAGKFYLFGSKSEEYFNRPKLPIDVSAYTPTALYNGMITPLIPYTIKGSIWYQGESNVGAADLYKIVFPMMIKNWRDDWKQGNFPFYFVQIAPWQYDAGSNSQKLREAQFLSLSIPKTGMAVTLDIGSPKTIHPSNKKDVGERLALWALAKDYNKKVVYSGPLYKSMKLEKEKIILTFDHVDGGLVINPKDGENNFLIAGEDKIFKKADVRIDGKKLIVSSPEVQSPVAVRYGWSDYVDASLFNKAGLPASSFRTDDWKE